MQHFLVKAPPVVNTSSLASAITNIEVRLHVAIIFGLRKTSGVIYASPCLGAFVHMMKEN